MHKDFQVLSQEKFWSWAFNTAHMWICCMECLLHIFYRLEFKAWQARWEELREMVKRKKKCIQDSLREKMGLFVDVPKSQHTMVIQGGDFFRMRVSLQKYLVLITSWSIVSLYFCARNHLFEKSIKTSFCNQNTELYVAKFKYPWYPMPHAVHKLLVHSHQIVRQKDIPVGMLSEEAQESSNKVLKMLRSIFHVKFQMRIQWEDYYAHQIQL